MEILGILLIALIILAFLKMIGLIFHIGLWAIALPFKIVGILIGSVIMVAILIPLGVLGALASLLMIPLAILIPLAPFILVGLGIWLLVRKNG
ncbi:MAG: hypothetical protein P8X42_14735 [Calditrichaceae bacterium]|jgi:hypothetical protein